MPIVDSGPTVRERLLEELGVEPCTEGALAWRLACHVLTVRDELESMRDADLVVEADGLWSLTPEGRG